MALHYFTAGGGIFYFGLSFSFLLFHLSFRVGANTHAKSLLIIEFRRHYYHFTPGDFFVLVLTGGLSLVIE